jgi:hypothetical protein
MFIIFILPEHKVNDSIISKENLASAKPLVPAAALVALIQIRII